MKVWRSVAFMLGSLFGLLSAQALPAADRTVRGGATQYHQHPGSETCVPVTVMNASRMLRGRFEHPNGVLRKLTRIGPTTDGTTNGGMRRQATAIRLTTIPLPGFAKARQLSSRGIPIAASIDPGKLPRRIQLAHGGPWDRIPASHEILIRKLDARGAVIEDPGAGRYRLRLDELRRAMGPQGDLHAFVQRG